jgi:hypothetical protein
MEQKQGGHPSPVEPHDPCGKDQEETAGEIFELI